MKRCRGVGISRTAVFLSWSPSALIVRDFRFNSQGPGDVRNFRFLSMDSTWLELKQWARTKRFVNPFVPIVESSGLPVHS
jgi:hypothetical protein